MRWHISPVAGFATRFVSVVSLPFLIGPIVNIPLNFPLYRFPDHPERITFPFLE